MQLNYRFWAGIVMMGMLAACQKSGTGQSAAAASEAQAQTVVYNVATDATYPPFEFTDEMGKIIGFDIDVLNAIAENQGFQVKYYNHVWDHMFDELQTNKADILASAIAITDEAKEKAALSNDYFTSPYAVVSLKRESIENNAWKNKTIAVSVNDDAAEYLEEEFSTPKQQFRRTETVYLALTDVVKGHAQVAAADATVMRYRIHSPTFTEADVKFHVKDLPASDPESIKLVFAVKKGNQELVNKINAGLANLKQSGELDKLIQKWQIQP